MRKRTKLEDRLEIAKRHRKGEAVATLAADYQVTERHIRRIVQNENRETVAKKTESKLISFRAPKAEIEAFLATAASVGIKGSSNAFRALIRMAEGHFEMFPNALWEFNNSVIQVRGIATNLNQLTMAVNRGKLRLLDEDRALLADVRSEVLRLRKELNATRDQFEVRRGYTRQSLLKEKEGSDGKD